MGSRRASDKIWLKAYCWASNPMLLLHHTPFLGNANGEQRQRQAAGETASAANLTCRAPAAALANLLAGLVSSIGCQARSSAIDATGAGCSDCGRTDAVGCVWVSNNTCPIIVISISRSPTVCRCPAGQTRVLLAAPPLHPTIASSIALSESSLNIIMSASVTMRVAGLHMPQMAQSKQAAAQMPAPQRLASVHSISSSRSSLVAASALSRAATSRCRGAAAAVVSVRSEISCECAGGGGTVVVMKHWDAVDVRSPLDAVLRWLGGRSVACLPPTLAADHLTADVMIKPDGVQRGLVGDIISRFERKGFKLVALKLFQCPRCARRAGAVGGRRRGPGRCCCLYDGGAGTLLIPFHLPPAPSLDPPTPPVQRHCRGALQGPFQQALLPRPRVLHPVGPGGGHGMGGRGRCQVGP